MRSLLGHGKGYVYPHMSEDHFTPQQYLPKELLGTYFYKPSSVGYEVEVADRLSRWRDAQRKALGITRLEEIPDLTQEQIDEMKRKIKIRSDEMKNSQLFDYVLGRDNEQDTLGISLWSGDLQGFVA